MGSKLIQQFVTLLAPYLDSIFARKAFFNLTFGTSTAFKQHINWRGDAKTFATHLIDVCIQHGENHGVSELDQILVTAISQVTSEDAVQMEALRQTLTQIDPASLQNWQAGASSNNIVAGDMRDVTGVAIGEGAMSIVTQIGRDQVINHYIERKTIIQASSITDLKKLPPQEGTPPYKGLAYYTEKDAPFFFGREELIHSLDRRIQHTHFLAIIGASGSGKSSLVRAGVIPVKRKQAWHIQVISPGAQPLTTLALSLTPHNDNPDATEQLRIALAENPNTLGNTINELATGRGHDRALLVIDQFEEVFTLCADKDERAAFIANLVTVAQSQLVTTVLISMRADFYSHCADYEGLRDLVATKQAFIGRMNEAELVRAIVEPARIGGWTFVEGLVGQIIEDLGHAPGGLPLLSHALLETWKRRRSNVMMLYGYREAGGIEGAIALTADQVLTELAPSEQTIAKYIFMSLTRLGERSADTRRPIKLTELSDKSEHVHHVLNRLSEARLVTIDEAEVEVAHEALIHAWPQLRQWLAENRDALRVQQRLQKAAEEWEVVQDSGLLYRGLRLAEVDSWLETHAETLLSSCARTFLAASQAEREREEAMRAEQRRKERQLIAERQAAQRSRWLAITLAAIAIILVGLTTWIRQARQQAIARELSLESANALDTDPELSILLAQSAVTATSTKNPLPQAKDALVEAISTSRVLHRLTDHNEPISHVVYSRPSGQFIASTSGDGSAKLWDSETGELLTTFFTDTIGLQSIDLFERRGLLHIAVGTSKGSIYGWAGDWQGDFDATRREIRPEQTGHHVWDVAFHPSGEWIATAEQDGTIRLLDFDTGDEMASYDEHMDEVSGVAFNEACTCLVSASYDQTAIVWDIVAGKLVQRFVLAGHQGAVVRATFSTDGRHVVTSSFDNTARVWDITTGDEVALLFGHDGLVENAVFSPDGKFIVTSSADKTIRLWTFDSAETATISSPFETIRGHTDRVWSLEFHPDGHEIVSGSRDKTIRIWSAELVGRETAFQAHKQPIHGVAVSPNGRWIATASADGTAKIWDAETNEQRRTLRGHNGEVFDVAFSPDNQHIITSDWSGKLHVWDIGQLQPIETIQADEGRVYGIAYHPTGQFFASAGLDSYVRIWDATTFQEVAKLKHGSDVRDVAFSPDGTQLVAAVNQQRAILWNWQTEEQVAEFIKGGHTEWELRRVAFHPDGIQFATSGNDFSARLWQIGEEAAQHSLIEYDHHDKNVWGIAYSPYGPYLATGGLDGAISLWDTRQLDAPIDSWSTQTVVRDLAWMPDGQRVVTVEEDGTLHIRKLLRADEVAVHQPRFETLWELSEERVTRTFTVEECEAFESICP